MKKSKTFTLMIALAVMLLVAFAGIHYFTRPVVDLPFRCSAFSRYDLSREEGKIFEFEVAHELRFINLHSGYLLLNGQVTMGDKVTVLNRRLVLDDGNRIDDDTFRYKIKRIVSSTSDSTPDALFNQLLPEITLDPAHLQLDITQLDKKTYFIGGPLSYLFVCQRY